MAERRSVLRRLLRPRILLPAAVFFAVVMSAGLYAFQPWKLVLDQTVDEAAPTGAPVAAGAPAEPSAAPVEAAEPTVLAQGELISHEHETTGSVRILGLPDGSRVLRLENFRTSNGPQLKVWLSDAAVVAGRAGWFTFDDGRYVDLGALKGNIGSQNYNVPAEVDLGALSSLSIWCDRFNVSFGAAELQPAV